MFVNKLKMNSVAEAVKKITEEEPVTEAEKVPTATGMRVYGSSYGNSAKARRDQVKKDIDTLKGPKAKELIQKDKEDYEKTKGRYDEAAKPDFLDMDKDGDKKEPMKKAVADKKKSGGMNETHEFKNKLIEALKGNQHKIDKNKNNKVDAQDFKILRGEKSVTEASCDDEVKKHEKKMHGKDGEVAKHVDKMHKEEVEQIDEVSLKTATSAYVKRMGDDGPNEKSSQDKAVKTMDYIAKKHGVRGVARATKTADDKYGLNDPVHNPRKAFVKQVMAGVKKEEVELDEAVMTHIALGKKVKNSEGGYDQTVHHKGEHIGNIHSYAHLHYETGKKTGRTKYATSDKHGGLMTVGHITPDEGVDELRWVHAQNKKTQKEEVELEERTMTSADKTERERIVKGMKKGFAGFRQRYGKDAKSVMYATATKQAMKEDTVEEEIDPKVRTKDTLKGQEPTAQKDDVGPGSDGKSTKVKFRGGPMREEVKKSDIPAFIRKARGDKPLTVADVKAGSKDSISSKENLAKARGVSEGKGPESDTVPFVTNADQPPFEGPYKKIGSTITDKSGAKHTPMSRARDLARSAMKRIKTEMLGKAPGNNG